MANLRTATKIFKILGGESGLKIFMLLGQRKKICVSDISKKIGLSISATSHQLQKIESTGLIDSFRTGRTICYIMKADKISNEVTKCVNQIAKKAKGRPNS